jgi:hypothetical protein
MAKTYFHIRKLDGGEVVDTIETEHTGRMKDRLERGLIRKVDPSRFYVDESDKPAPKGGGS